MTATAQATWVAGRRLHVGRRRHERLHRAGEVQVEVARLGVRRERVEVSGDRVRVAARDRSGERGGRPARRALRAAPSSRAASASWASGGLTPAASSSRVASASSASGALPASTAAA